MRTMKYFENTEVNKMPETIVNLIEQIAAVKGAEYAKGMVDMANLLQPEPKEDFDKQNKE